MDKLDYLDIADFLMKAGYQPSTLQEERPWTPAVLAMEMWNARKWTQEEPKEKPE